MGSIMAVQRAPSVCHLWRVPQEIRDLIYEQLFRSTRLSHGYAAMDNVICGEVLITPDPHSLALLRTCRRIRFEIGGRWKRHVLFNFHDIATMMNKLTSIPREDLSELRHVRVRAEISLVLRGRYRDLFSMDLPGSFVHYLNLLPGLRLDTLTILDTSTIDDHYRLSALAVANLIKHGEGWRELRIISLRGELLYKNAVEVPGLRAFWVAQLKSRDGPNPQSSLEVRRFTPGTKTFSAILAPQEDRSRRPNQGSRPSLSLWGRYTGYSRRGLYSQDIMIIVKRGKRVDVQQKGHVTSLRSIRAELSTDDARSLQNKWPAIRSSLAYATVYWESRVRRRYMRLCFRSILEYYDEYERPDDYQWMPLKCRPHPDNMFEDSELYIVPPSDSRET